MLFRSGFFWRYNQLDANQQGYDTSVSSIDPENSDIQQYYFEILQKKIRAHFKFLGLLESRREMDKEGVIYALLRSIRVPNIPPFGKGNDVRDHTTLTIILKEEMRACSSKEMVLFRPYRMTLDAVGRPLTSFDCSRKFVSAIANAVEGKNIFLRTSPICLTAGFHSA